MAKEEPRILPATDRTQCPQYPACELRGIPLWAPLHTGSPDDPGLFLWSAKAKLDWAYSRIHDLRDVIKMTAEENLHHRVARVEPESDAQILKYRLEMRGYPLGIALYLADALLALRSTLDYIAQGMVRPSGNPKKRPRFAGFPILDGDPKVSRDAAQKWLDTTFGMPERCTEFLERFQAHAAENGSDEAAFAPWLAHLRTTTNHEKHRRLVGLDMYAWISAAAVEHSTGEPVRFLQNVGTKAFKDEAEVKLAAFRSADGTRLSDFDCDGEPQFVVTPDIRIEGWAVPKDARFKTPFKSTLICQLEWVYSAVEFVMEEARSNWAKLRPDI